MHVPLRADSAQARFHGASEYWFCPKMSDQQAGAHCNYGDDLIGCVYNGLFFPYSQHHTCLAIPALILMWFLHRIPVGVVLRGTVQQLRERAAQLGICFQGNECIELPNNAEMGNKKLDFGDARCFLCTDVPAAEYGGQWVLITRHENFWPAAEEPRRKKTRQFWAPVLYAIQESLQPQDLFHNAGVMMQLANCRDFRGIFRSKLTHLLCSGKLYASFKLCFHDGDRHMLIPEVMHQVQGVWMNDLGLGTPDMLCKYLQVLDNEIVCDFYASDLRSSSLQGWCMRSVDGHRRCGFEGTPPCDSCMLAKGSMPDKVELRVTVCVEDDNTIKVSLTTFYESTKLSFTGMEGHLSEVGHLCCICMQRDVNILFLPCKHVAVCDICVRLWEISQNGKCPVCRANVTGHRDVILAGCPANA